MDPVIKGKKKHGGTFSFNGSRDTSNVVDVGPSGDEYINFGPIVYKRKSTGADWFMHDKTSTGREDTQKKKSKFLRSTFLPPKQMASQN